VRLISQKNTVYGIEHEYYAPFVFHKRKKVMFVTTWRRVNDDRIFIVGWTILFKLTVWD